MRLGPQQAVVPLQSARPNVSAKSRLTVILNLPSFMYSLAWRVFSGQSGFLLRKIMQSQGTNLRSRAGKDAGAPADAEVGVC